jgi:hypothetical protein
MLAMFAVLALVPASLWAALAQFAWRDWAVTVPTFVGAEIAVILLLCAVASGKHEGG